MLEKKKLKIEYKQQKMNQLISVNNINSQKEKKMNPSKFLTQDYDCPPLI